MRARQESVECTCLACPAQSWTCHPKQRALALRSPSRTGLSSSWLFPPQLFRNRSRFWRRIIDLCKPCSQGFWVGGASFRLRAGPVEREDPSLRLKDGSAQDDSRRVIVTLHLVAARRKYFVLRRWNRGGVALLILPEDSIQPCCSGGVGAGEIHLRRLACASGIGFVRLVDEAVLQVSIVRLEGGLSACAGEHWSHRRGIRVILVHGRQAQQHLHGVNRVDGGVEAVVDVRLSRGAWRVLADDESDGAVSVYVVAAVLSVIFEDEDGGVLPVGAVGDGIDYAAES